MAEENKVPTTASAQTTPPAPEEKKDDVVSVPKTVLENILNRLDAANEEINNLKTAQNQYEQTASQDQIMKIEKLRASGKLVKAVKLNYYDNQLVVSWKSTTDDVYVDNQGKEISVQKTKLTFAEGKDIEIPQIDFARRKLQRQYEVVKEGKDREGNMLYTVITEGGKEVEIDGRFVN